MESDRSGQVEGPGPLVNSGGEIITGMLGEASSPPSERIIAAYKAKLLLPLVEWTGIRSWLLLHLLFLHARFCHSGWGHGFEVVRAEQEPHQRNSRYRNEKPGENQDGRITEAVHNPSRAQSKDHRSNACPRA